VHRPSVAEYPTCFPALGLPFDGPLPYSQAPPVGSPVFNRYYEATKTTSLLGWCSVCSVAPPYLGRCLGFRSTTRRHRPVVARMLLDQVHPLPVCCSKDTVGPPKFPRNPSVPLPCSSTPVGPPRLATTASRYCPRQSDNEGSNVMITFGAQSHGFSTGCLRFVPSSRTTTQNSLPGVANLSGWDFSLPTEFLRRVSASRPSPLLGLCLARQISNLPYRGFPTR
jgi:hypothetical protein